MRVARLLVLSAVVATLVAAVPPYRRTAVPSQITVYHSPSCLCCKAWVRYLQSNGFTVKSIEQDDLSDIKAELGVTPKLASCHTAVIQSYVVEGHVPVADIQRMLKEKPRITGITAPGMPGAAPGMDIGKDPYEVLAFDGHGKSTLWARR